MRSDGRDRRCTGTRVAGRRQSARSRRYVARTRHIRCARHMALAGQVGQPVDARPRRHRRRRDIGGAAASRRDHLSGTEPRDERAAHDRRAGRTAGSARRDEIGHRHSRQPRRWSNLCRRIGRADRVRSRPGSRRGTGNSGGIRGWRHNCACSRRRERARGRSCGVACRHCRGRRIGRGRCGRCLGRGRRTGQGRGGNRARNRSG